MADSKAGLCNAEEKNVQKVICDRCRSVILLPTKGTWTELETKFLLPHMKKKKEIEGSASGEELAEFWVVDDMFTFENVGFTNAVEGIKYLICADCEVGPIGYHDPSNPKAFYVAVSRVQYDS